MSFHRTNQMTKTELRLALEANVAEMARLLDAFQEMPADSIDEEDDCDILGMLTDLECLQGSGQDVGAIDENVHDAIYESIASSEQVKQIEV